MAPTPIEQTVMTQSSVNIVVLIILTLAILIGLIGSSK